MENLLSGDLTLVHEEVCPLFLSFVFSYSKHVSAKFSAALHAAGFKDSHRPLTIHLVL